MLIQCPDCNGIGGWEVSGLDMARSIKQRHDREKENNKEK